MTGYNDPIGYNTNDRLYNGTVTPDLLVLAAGEQLQDRTITGTVKITDRVEERTVATFAVEDPDAIPDLVRGHPVAIRIFTERAFNGVVDEPKGAPAGPFGHVLTVPCVDWHYLADRRIVSAGFESTFAGDIARWVVDQLAADGVSEGTIEDGPPVSEVAFAWVPASKVMDRLSDEADFTWYVDGFKRLHFHTRAAVAAPWTLDTVDEYADAFRIERGNREFRTRQIIRGGKAETDPQNESFVADGVQKTFVVGFPLGREPTIEEDSVVQPVGVKGFGEAGARWLWARGSAEITLADTETPPANGVMIDVTYRGLYDLVMVATDQAAADDLRDTEGFGTGLVDHVVSDTSITSALSAAERGSRMLERYARLGRRVKFRTTRSGLRAGMLLTADLPDRGLDGVQLLVGEVVTTIGPGVVLHDVTAFEGPIEGSWAKWFARLADVADPLAFRENVSEEETVIILDSTAESTGWGETSVQQVYACDVSHATDDGFNDPTIGYNDPVRYQGDVAELLTFPASETGYADAGVGYNDPINYQGTVTGGRPVVC